MKAVVWLLLLGTRALAPSACPIVDCDVPVRLDPRHFSRKKTCNDVNAGCFCAQCPDFRATLPGLGPVRACAMRAMYCMGGLRSLTATIPDDPWV